MEFRIVRPALEIGQLVTIHTDPTWNGVLKDSSDFPMMTLYETISLHSFPSFNDYHGGTTFAREGDVALVLGLKGRPNLRYGSCAEIGEVEVGCLEVDVYRILLGDQVRECFRLWLEPIPEVG